MYGVDIPGLVPEMEEREAAIFNGYQWRKWRKLPHDERVTGVAHFRLHGLIEHHQQDAVARHSRDEERRRAAMDPSD